MFSGDIFDFAFPRKFAVFELYVLQTFSSITMFAFDEIFRHFPLFRIAVANSFRYNTVGARRVRLFSIDFVSFETYVEYLDRESVNV